MCISDLVSELDSSGQHLSDQISEIDLSDPEDAKVLLPAQGTDILAHFGSDHFLERFQRYKAHIAEWRQQYPKLAEVDLRYEQQVVLQMTGGGHTRRRQSWIRVRLLTAHLGRRNLTPQSRLSSPTCQSLLSRSARMSSKPPRPTLQPSRLQGRKPSKTKARRRSIPIQSTM